jgi:hypothetical protein
LVVFHPPYFDLIHYSGRAWGDEPHPADLSAAPSLDQFIRMANEAQYAAYSHVKQGGHVAILIGSLRRQGQLYPLHRMINLYGELVVDGVKVQFNTTGGRNLRTSKFPLLATEWVMVTKKPQAWIVPVQVANAPKEFNMRRNERQTWRSIVLSALEASGGSASTEEIYNEIEPHSRAQAAADAGTDWQAIVRRELQEGPFRSISYGIWALV